MEFAECPSVKRTPSRLGQTHKQKHMGGIIKRKGSMFGDVAFAMEYCKTINYSLRIYSEKYSLHQAYQQACGIRSKRLWSDEKIRKFQWISVKEADIEACGVAIKHDIGCEVKEFWTYNVVNCEIEAQEFVVLQENDGSHDLNVVKCRSKWR